MPATVTTKVVSSESSEAEVVGTPTIRPMLSLRNRREELVKYLYIDLQVPRWENPQVWVRYKPFITSGVENSYEKFKEDAEATVRSQADILVNCCVGVYATLPDVLGADGKPLKFTLDPKYPHDDPPVVGDPESSWTKFDERLAINLGVEGVVKAAVEICRKVYLTDGDLLDAAVRVVEFSAQSNEKANRDF